MKTKEEIKKLAAEQAFVHIEPHMTIGIGTGSTVYWFIQELARRVRAGLICRCVPTSTATNVMAIELGIPMITLNDAQKIDVTIDGADEIDPQLSVIKGGGGALLQEKMVAAASDKLVIIADSSKLVQQLGAFPLPVEVIPYGWKQVQQHIAFTNDAMVVRRMKDDAPFITDHGHYILDCHFKKINDPANMAITLNTTPGVVENGLFLHMANIAVIANADGTVQTLMAE